MTLGNDPMGGIDKISAANAMHNSDADNKQLAELFEHYSTGAKGANGLPNGERWIEKWQASLAAEEIIRSWATVSEGAVEKFVKDHFDMAWSSYDNY